MSDTHLSASDPANLDRFGRFLAGPCAGARRVFLLGDLFDFWVSPSQARDPAFRPALDGLRRLVDSGVDVGFVEGNRDFAATPVLRAFGVTPLPDVVLVENDGHRTAITHGDLLCTRDTPYQALRRLVRTATFRHLLHRAPRSVAMGVGRSARAGSRLETRRKAYGDMALQPLAVASLLRICDADALVCGHVHWGQRFRVGVDGIDRDVVVLSAWDRRGTYAVLDRGRLDFLWFD